MSSNVSRPVNWLEDTRRSIATRFPNLDWQGSHMTERLAVLLLERLPPELGLAILGLLPRDSSGVLQPLWRAARGGEDRSIGYPDFLERASSWGAVTDIMARELVDTFLWSVAQELPPDIKTRLRETLPRELTSRMSLYSSVADEARVA